MCIVSLSAWLATTMCCCLLIRSSLALQTRLDDDSSIRLGSVSGWCNDAASTVVYTRTEMVEASDPFGNITFASSVAECEQACTSATQPPCQAASFSSTNRICQLHKQPIYPNGDHPPLLREHSTYLEKTCWPKQLLQQSACSHSGIYRIIGLEPTYSAALNHSRPYVSSSLTQCMQLCVRATIDTDFHCKSGTYWYNKRGANCLLLSFAGGDRAVQPNAFRVGQRLVDYFQFNCGDDDKDTFQSQLENLLVIGFCFIFFMKVKTPPPAPQIAADADQVDSLNARARDCCAQTYRFPKGCQLLCSVHNFTYAKLADAAQRNWCTPYGMQAVHHCLTRKQDQRWCCARQTSVPADCTQLCDARHRSIQTLMAAYAHCQQHWTALMACFVNDEDARYRNEQFDQISRQYDVPPQLAAPPARQPPAAPVDDSLRARSCCLNQPELPDGCLRLCSYDAFNKRNLIRNWLSCGLRHMSTIAVCLSRHADQESCCLAFGMPTRCARLCAHHHLHTLGADLRYLQCLEPAVLEPIKQCWRAPAPMRLEEELPIIPVVTCRGMPCPKQRIDFS